MISVTLTEATTTKNGTRYEYWRAQWYENGEAKTK